MMTLMPLCKSYKAATRDGWAGENAHFLLPFTPSGYWYADGKLLSFPKSLIPQNPSHTISGEYRNLPFHKAAGVCVSPNPGF